MKSCGPDFLKMIDRIWSVIDSVRKSIESKIAGKNWLSINREKQIIG